MLYKNRRYVSLYENPLHKVIWEFLDTTKQLNIYIDVFLTRNHKFKKEIEDKSFHLTGHVPIDIFDLTQISKPSSETPLQIITPVKKGDYIDYLQNAEYRDIGYLISEIYECFETFLYDIISIYFQHKKKGYKQFENFKDIRRELKADFRSSNNSKVFKFLRSESQCYRKYENENVISYKMIEWYSVFSIVRHSITHSGFRINKEAFNKLNPFHQGMLSFIFRAIETQNHIILKPDYNSFKETYIRSGSHALLIFRALSSELGLESTPLFTYDSDQRL